MSDKRIAILTDSTCDIPQDLRKKHNIYVIPQVIVWGEEVLRDGMDISNDTFFNRLVSDVVHPTTSQPSVHDFTEMYKKIAKDADEIVAVLLSDELSKTVASARGAKEEVDIPVHVVDSRAVSLALGASVLAAAVAREQGGDAAAMVAAAEKRAKSTRIVFVVDTLEYLHKGGRIGGAAKFVGTALNLKPLLHVEDGRVEATERVRTRSKALVRMVEIAADGLDVSASLGGAVVHGTAPEDAAKVAELLKEKYKLQEFMMSGVTPVIGVHTGPGVVGVVVYEI